MKHITEEALVDYVMGHLEQKEQKQINQHVLRCEECRERLSSWKQLTTVNKKITPSSELHTTIHKSIKTKTKPKKKKLKSYYVAASTAAILILTFTIFIVNQDSHEMVDSKDEYITAQHNLIPEQTFLNKPDTNRLDILPVTMDRNIQGNVWLNEATNELIFQVDGLQPLEANDYQVWLIHEDNVWNDELLRINNGRVQVYYKGPDVRTIRFIKVSVEPIGGSQIPTGPETLFIDLHQ